MLAWYRKGRRCLCGLTICTRGFLAVAQNPGRIGSSDSLTAALWLQPSLLQALVVLYYRRHVVKPTLLHALVLCLFHNLFLLRFSVRHVCPSSKRYSIVTLLSLALCAYLYLFCKCLDSCSCVCSTSAAATDPFRPCDC